MKQIKNQNEPGVASDRVKTTIRLTFRSAEKTLEQEEVQPEVKRLSAALAENLRVIF